jgi:CxxC-x17-CxxC domain-containing protein
LSLQDKTLRCTDCGNEFTFSVEDQEFFRSKGYANEPKRCPECRQAKRAERSGNSGYGAQRQMFQVICAECGKSTEVPFQPRGDRPVYCSDCFRKVKPSR